MKKVLVIVDVQNDFVDGALGTKEAVEILPYVKEEIAKKYDDVFVTFDTHEENYLETLEGKNLPVKHCIRHTEGWELNKEIQDALENVSYIPVEKPTFGSCTLVQMITALQPDEITLVGLCTDICVVSNALILKALFPETEISVDGKCCAGVTPHSHLAALETMKSCQINIL